MSLITCPECGREVSDQAASCPQCGYPIKASRDLWRVQYFAPKRRVSLENLARSERGVTHVEWEIKGESLITRDLFPKSVAQEIANKVCPPYAKNCYT